MYLDMSFFYNDPINIINIREHVVRNQLSIMDLLLNDQPGS